MKLGEHIRMERKKIKGMGIEKLARLAGLSHMTLWKIEVGETKDPKMDTIARIANALGVSIDTLTMTRKDT